MPTMGPPATPVKLRTCEHRGCGRRVFEVSDATGTRFHHYDVSDDYAGHRALVRCG